LVYLVTAITLHSVHTVIRQGISSSAMHECSQPILFNPPRSLLHDGTTASPAVIISVYLKRLCTFVFIAHRQDTLIAPVPFQSISLSSSIQQLNTHELLLQLGQGCYVGHSSITPVAYLSTKCSLNQHASLSAMMMFLST